MTQTKPCCYQCEPIPPDKWCNNPSCECHGVKCDCKLSAQIVDSHCPIHSTGLSISTPEQPTDWNDSVLNPIRDGIMDFNIHVREITGGNNRGCVDSTNLVAICRKTIQNLLLSQHDRLKTRYEGEIKELAKDHYWDSLEKDKDIILLHLDELLALIKKE